MGKIRNGDRKIVDGGADLQKLLMRDAQKIVEEAELVNQFESGRVNGVAAKIAKKVGVFFEDEGFDAGAGEEEAENHTGGAAASYAAGGLRGFRRVRFGRHGSRLGSRVCHRFMAASLILRPSGREIESRDYFITLIVAEIRRL
jgi:hypothetical protein